MDSFTTALYGLAQHGQYGALHNEMFWDRIVITIRNSSLVEMQHLDTELTLSKVVTLVHQAEVIRQQQPLLRGKGHGVGEETRSGFHTEGEGAYWNLPPKSCQHPLDSILGQLFLKIYWGRMPPDPPRRMCFACCQFRKHLLTILQKSPLPPA